MTKALQTKCKTYFGSPRMIQDALWKKYFFSSSKMQYGFFTTLADPPPQVWKKTIKNTGFFSGTLPLVVRNVIILAWWYTSSGSNVGLLKVFSKCSFGLSGHVSLSLRSNVWKVVFWVFLLFVGHLLSPHLSDRMSQVYGITLWWYFSWLWSEGEWQGHQKSWLGTATNIHPNCFVWRKLKLNETLKLTY